MRIQSRRSGTDPTRLPLRYLPAMDGDSELSRDRDDLVELLARYASIPDSNDWEHLPASVFADEVLWNFESLDGQAAQAVSRSSLIDALRTAFAVFEATHHAITNHRVIVDKDVASVRAHVRAEHWFRSDLVPSGDNRWLIVGFYDDEAVRTPVGWRLRSVRLTVTHRENDHLFAMLPTADA